MKSWSEVIDEQKQKLYYKSLMQKVDEAYSKDIVYPSKDKIFFAFTLTPTTNLKVVILGQDPYHNPNEAQGLAFSTPGDIKNPPSMKNILKEIQSDLSRTSSCSDGDLSTWAKDGVLLINTILTVKHKSPKSHHKFGWEEFSDNIIRYINNYHENIVFLLWGNNAIAKSSLIDKNRHYVLASVHPSPLSAYRGFFGCKHFSKANSYLISHGKKPINW